MSRRPVTAVLAACLLSASLTACGTGLEAQNYKPRTPHDSTSATVDKLAIRNLAVQPGAEGVLDAGGTALITGVIVNSGTEDDALLSATTDAASSAVLQAGGTSESVALPARGSSGTSWAIALEGLSTALLPGAYIDVTLEFEKASRTTVRVPVRTGDAGLGDREVAEDPYHTDPGSTRGGGSKSEGSGETKH